jgi:hypothetical protein
MRLKEFADPKDHAAIIVNIEDLVDQLRRIWPDDDLSFVLEFINSQDQRVKVIDGL